MPVPGPIASRLSELAKAGPLGRVVDACRKTSSSAAMIIGRPVASAVCDLSGGPGERVRSRIAFRASPASIRRLLLSCGELFAEGGEGESPVRGIGDPERPAVG